MPIPAEYSTGKHSPRFAREAATEEAMQAHITQVLSMREIIGNGTLNLNWTEMYSTED